MRTLRQPGLPLCVLASLCGCSGTGHPERWLDEAVALDAPVGDDSRYPHLATSDTGGVVLSWLQAMPDGGFALRYATWQSGDWSPPRTVATGTDWFINWADFPSVVPVGGTTWAAHWLVQSGGSVYAYDVHTAVSSDGGRTWSAAAAPHDDGTPTEHGFVSLFTGTDGIRAVWLDGRMTAGDHGRDGHGTGAMTLRSTVLGEDGRRRGDDDVLDERVCDCCQTDVAATSEGPVVVYRDRSDQEVRDVAIVRLEQDGWSRPVTVHGDGWRIDACPVNGPAVAARGLDVVVAWFTAPDLPRVRLAFSDDGGRSFATPFEVASGDVTGRVDVVLLDDGRAVVSWLQGSAAGAEIRAQPFTRTGAAGPAVVVAGTTVQRASGFPQMVLARNGLLFAWTDTGDPTRVRTAYAGLR